MEDRLIIGFQSRRNIFIIIQQVILSENLNLYFLRGRGQLFGVAVKVAAWGQMNEKVGSKKRIVLVN